MIKLSTIKANPNNPRVINSDKFKKLVKSIKDFPKMMELRPMVINKDNIVLGGNMRLKALKELGYKEVPKEWVKRAEDLTDDEQRQFIIKDNIGFGEHDWEMLVTEWDASELGEWGLEVPNWSAGVEENEMTDEDVDITEEFDPIGVSAGQQRVVFIFDGAEEAESYLNSLNVDVKKQGQAWQVDLSTQSIL